MKPEQIPRVFVDLYRATKVGEIVSPPTLPEPPYPEWENDVVTGGGFEPARNGRVRRVRTLPDTIGARMRLLIVGLNPSEYAADAGVGFARPGNRFWPAALEAGIVTRDRDPLHALTAHRIGMTDLVKRATPRADALASDEYRSGMARIARIGAWLRPKAICFVGLAGYRVAVDRRATAGWQEDAVGACHTYVMPNPSGLNAHVRVSDLAAHLRAFE